MLQSCQLARVVPWSPAAVDLARDALAAHQAGRVEVLPTVAAAQALAPEALAAADHWIVPLHVQDGDTLALLRGIASLGRRPSVLLISREPPSVGHAAVAFLASIGIGRVQLLRPDCSLAELGRALALQLPPDAVRRPDAPLAEADVRAALAEDRLEMHFQPKVHLGSGEIVGVEALLRMRMPDGTATSPAAVFAAVRSADLHAQITLLAVREAVRLSAACLERGQPVASAVNASVVQLADARLCDELARIARAQGIDPCWLTLELTEHDAMGDTSSTLENATRVRMHGFGLSLDDFGTGHSSFERLATIPFTELKVDRSLVRGVAASERVRAVARSCCDVAHHFGLRAVAEGIETPADLAAVRALGFDYVQGWIHGRAMPASALLELLDTHGGRVARAP